MLPKCLWIIPFLFLFATISAPNVHADTIYTYTGNNPQTSPSCGSIPCLFGNSNFGNSAITGSFTLPTEVVSDAAANMMNVYPGEFSFTDSELTWNENNSTFQGEIADVGGVVGWWLILLKSNDGADLFTTFQGSTFEATDSTPNMQLQGDKGSWTVTNQPIGTPEPGTGVLLLVGIGLVLVMRKRMTLGHQQAS